MTESIQMVVMIFGAVVAAVGIVLLFVDKSEGRNAVKAFGIEFEVSTRALAVLLIGSVIFVLPFVVPHRKPAPDQSVARVPTPQIEPTPKPVDEKQAPTQLVPSSVEIEPNDGCHQPTHIVTDTNVRGQLSIQTIPRQVDSDFFWFNSGTKQSVRVNVTFNVLGLIVRVAMVDDKGIRVADSLIKADDKVARMPEVEVRRNAVYCLGLQLEPTSSVGMLDGSWPYTLRVD